jgi:signal recognition particle GTPase
MSVNSTPPEHLQGPKDNHVKWLLHRIWERLNRRNEHFMGVIVGQEGSGKSYTAIKIAKNVDPSFNAGRVIFDVADLLEVLTEGEHEPGNFYVLDEAGVQLGRRTWQDRSQILANQALQLIRDHNLGLIFTLPRLSEFDSQAQGRLQAMYEITKKVEGEYVKGKWKFFDPDRADDTGKIYKKYPRRIQNGQRKRIRRLAFSPPTGDMVGQYEDRKDDFQEEFYKETIAEIRGEDADDNDAEEEESMSVQDIATEVAQNIERVVAKNNNTGKPYINRDLIRANYGCTQANARAVKATLEKQFSTNELAQYV